MNAKVSVTHCAPKFSVTAAKSPAVLRAIDARRDEIVGVARQIASHPELGFKEVRTATLVADRFAGLGIAGLDRSAGIAVKDEAAGRKTQKAIRAMLKTLPGTLFKDRAEFLPAFDEALNKAGLRLAAPARPLQMRRKEEWKKICFS